MDRSEYSLFSYSDISKKKKYWHIGIEPEYGCIIMITCIMIIIRLTLKLRIQGIPELSIHKVCCQISFLYNNFLKLAE